MRLAVGDKLLTIMSIGDVINKSQVIQVGEDGKSTTWSALFSVLLSSCRLLTVFISVNLLDVYMDID